MFSPKMSWTVELDSPLTMASFRQPAEYSNNFIHLNFFI